MFCKIFLFVLVSVIFVRNLAFFVCVSVFMYMSFTIVSYVLFDICSFSDSDVETVHYCFKFTATVLHSALAVQSERKLKNQTQVRVVGT